MLPSGWIVASKVALGRNNSALVSRPCSSAVNFMLRLSHTNGRFSGLLKKVFGESPMGKFLLRY